MRIVTLIIAALLLAAPAAFAQQEPPPADPKPAPADKEPAGDDNLRPPAQARHIPGAADLDSDDEGLPPGFSGGKVAQPKDTADLIGRFHPVMIHLTIGWLFLLLLVDLGTFLGKIQEWRRAGPFILLATILSAIPSIVTGFIRHDYVTGFFKQQLVGLHQNVMLAMVGACVLAFIVRVRSRNQPTGGITAVYLLLIVTAAFLCMVGGHLGAKMVFGPNYFPF